MLKTVTGSDGEEIQPQYEIAYYCKLMSERKL